MDSSKFIKRIRAIQDEDDNIIYGISTTYRDAGKEIYVQLI